MSDLLYYIEMGRPDTGGISPNDFDASKSSDATGPVVWINETDFTRSEYNRLENGENDYESLKDEILGWLDGEPYNQKDQSELTIDEILGSSKSCVKHVTSLVEIDDETIEYALDLIFRDLDKENGHSV